MIRLANGGAIAVLLTGCCFMGFADEPSVTLQWRFEPDQVLTCRVKGTGTMSTIVGQAARPLFSANARLDITYKWQVVSVSEEEVTDLQISIVAGYTDDTLTGRQEIVTGTGPSIQVKLDKQGKVIKITGLKDNEVLGGVFPFELAPISGLLLGFGGLPQKAVLVGESWQAKTTVEFVGLQRFEFKSVSNLRAIKSVNGQQCAEIHSIIEFPVAEYYVAAARQNDPAHAHLLAGPATGIDRVQLTCLFILDEGRVVHEKIASRAEVIVPVRDAATGKVHEWRLQSTGEFETSVQPLDGGSEKTTEGPKAAADHKAIDDQPEPEGTQVDADILVEEGMVAKRAGKLDEAVSKFGQALDEDPNNVEAHWGLAWVLGAQDEGHEAITHFEQVIQLTDDAERKREAKAAIERLKSK